MAPTTTPAPMIPTNETREPNRDAPESRMNRIAKRAHEIYEARGSEYGRAIDHWLQAESEIDGESPAPSDD
jgi:hypothetical protein